ncbi:hypothetical protein RRG08_007909 [Elysia crispata]|uniref:Uncharacterized protein n=1 Tax=Elysia crispata TaxID=231223 RepID=A0AAE0XW87_9GAST|nr:hypothetical protein RRG08_007909 [Elysia crispata]
MSMSKAWRSELIVASKERIPTERPVKPIKQHWMPTTRSVTAKEATSMLVLVYRLLLLAITKINKLFSRNRATPAQTTE